MKGVIHRADNPRVVECRVNAFVLRSFPRNYSFMLIPIPLTCFFQALSCSCCIHCVFFVQTELGLHDR